MLAGWGFVIWMLCSVGCGLAKGFWSFLVLRVIMGAGEASIVNLTGPYIDDVAPPKHKTLWFGILFLVRPLTISIILEEGRVLRCSSCLVQQIIAAPCCIWNAGAKHTTRHAPYSSHSSELSLSFCRSITASNPGWPCVLNDWLHTTEVAASLSSPFSRVCLQFPTLGIAAGYIFGGVVGLDYGWRIPFFIQVLPCPGTAGRVWPWGVWLQPVP